MSNQHNFCGKVTGVGREEAIVVIDPEFREVFDAVSHDFIYKQAEEMWFR